MYIYMYICIYIHVRYVTHSFVTWLAPRDSLTWDRRESCHKSTSHVTSVTSQITGSRDAGNRLEIATKLWCSVQGCFGNRLRRKSCRPVHYPLVPTVSYPCAQFTRGLWGMYMPLLRIQRHVPWRRYWARNCTTRCRPWVPPPVYVNRHTHVIHIHMYIYVFVYMHMCGCVCVHECTRTRYRSLVPPPICMNTHTQVHICVCVYVCVCVCVCVCVQCHHKVSIYSRVLCTWSLY